MADREIKLKVTIEDSQAKRAADDAAKGQKKLEDAAKRANKEAQDGHDANAKGFSITSVLGKQFGDVLGSVASQFTLLSVGQKVIDAIADSFAAARKAAQEGVEFNKQYKESLLEIAALKGNLGAVTAEMREQLKFRAKTLQTAGDAKAFQSEYLNVGNVNVGKSISPADFKTVMVEAAKFQAVESGDAGVHAKLAAVAPAMMGAKPGGGMWTAQDVMANHQATFNQMQFGAFKFASGAKQLIQSQGLLAGGGFKNSREMAGMLTALSNQGDSETAGTSLAQLNTALMGSAKKLKAPLVDGESMKIATYFKSLGYKDGMKNSEIMGLIHGDLTAQEAKNPDFQVGTYLQSRGYGNAESVNAIGMAHRSMALGQWGPHMERAANASGMNPGDENAPNFVSYDQRMTAFNHSQTAAGRRADIGNEAAKSSAGLPLGYYAEYQKGAFASLGQDKASGDFETWKKDFTWGGNSKLDREIVDAAMSEAARVGLTAEDKGYGWNPRKAQFDEHRYQIGDKQFGARELYGMNDEQKASLFGEIGSQVESKGGNVSEELLRRSVETNARLSKAVEALEKRMTPDQAPAALPARAPAANRRT